MRFSRWMLVVLTPIGVAIGLHEAWRLAGGLVLLMALQIVILTAVIVGLVRAVRRESAQGAGK
ncbi:MAG: hypothetical protein WDO12_11570 [Pseudomonadota bacterium]